MSRFLPFCLLVFISNLVYAQSVCLKVDALPVFTELKVIRPSLEIKFEERFTGNFAYENGVFATGFHQTNNQTPLQVYSLKGWGAIAELRYFPFQRKRQAPFGLYISPFLRYGALTEHYTGEDELMSGAFNPVKADVKLNGTATHYGAMIGHKGRLGPFLAEVAAGFGAGQVNYTNEHERQRIPDTFRESGDRTFYPRLELNVGFVIMPKAKRKLVYMVGPSIPLADTSHGDKALIKMYRGYVFKGTSDDPYTVYANGTAVKYVKNGTFHEFYCDSGDIRLRARTLAITDLNIHVYPAQVYYLRCGVRRGFMRAEPTLELVSPEVGEKEIQDLMIEKNKRDPKMD